jgi:hypothetical protein
MHFTKKKRKIIAIKTVKSIVKLKSSYSSVFSHFLGSQTGGGGERKGKEKEKMTEKANDGECYLEDVIEIGEQRVHFFVTGCRHFSSLSNILTLRPPHINSKAPAFAQSILNDKIIYIYIYIYE